MTFVRSRPYEIKQGQNDTVLVTYTPESFSEETESGVSEREFDLVILSVGIRPAPDSAGLAEKLMVPLDEQGFFGFKNASSLPALQREGIYTVGACESPKDIQSCIAQAEATGSVVISGNH